MRGTISALTLASGCFALCCLDPAPARADLHLAFGTKWEPLKYTTGVFPNPQGANRQFSFSNGFQNTDLDPYLALYFAQKYGVMLSLDIGYGKYTGAGYTYPTGMPTVEADANTSYFQFGFSLGFKMYITQPRKAKISPYLYVDFFKYFASVSLDQSPMTMINDPNTASYYGSLLSPVGGTLAFGAEYFFTPGFSLGAEVFGLKIGNSGGDLYSTNAAGQSAKARSDSYTYVTMYTAITMNFRFGIQTSIRASQVEDPNDEEAARKQQKAAPPADGQPPAVVPAPPPAPTSPESVD